MNSKRIQMLRQQMKEAPQDPFFSYALALEYKESDPQKCLEQLLDSRKRFPDYLPVYYQLAEVLLVFGKKELAFETYDAGIALASRQKDLKTLAELRNAKQNLLFDEEED
jgi:predicted RNA polymerase sigma factor